MMHFVSPPRNSNSSDGTLAPHLMHSYTIPDFSIRNASSYKEKYFAFKHFQYLASNKDMKARKRLREKLSNELSLQDLDQIYNSFDIIGDIAIIKMNNGNNVKAEAVANRIMSIHKGVKSVFAKAGPISGEFRLRALKLVSGESKTITRYRESGCMFMVDIEKCYFSPRLLYERSRIAGLVKPKEIVVNMFAGVGCFSIIIAKTLDKTKIFSIDVNPMAIHFMKENIRINRVFGRVIPLFGDSKEIIQADLHGRADRVLMPLPEKALEYLPYAICSLKNQGGWIHYYDFQHAIGNENPLEKTRSKVAEKLDCLGLDYSFAFSRVVRRTGPNWYQTVLDIHIASVPSKFL
jgi:tRNA (guanine37-N1)-methyltransferase